MRVAGSGTLSGSPVRSQRATGAGRFGVTAVATLPPVIEDSDLSEAQPRRPVELLGASVAAFAATQMWLDDLFQELQLLAIGEDRGLQMPPELVRLGAQIRALIERPRLILSGQIAAAAADGREVVDLTVELGPLAVPHVARMMLLLDELDEQCRSGVLLTAPRSPDVYASLRWLAREIVGQLEVGRAPRPYASPAA
jgi:hypothetical protein